MRALRDIAGVLLDVDGTLLVGDRAVAGAARALERLDRPWAVITNTTRRSRAAIAGVLRAAGLDVGEDDVFTPAALARRRILDSDRPRTVLLVADEARRDFEGLHLVDGDPQWIVLGDLGSDFTWERMNRIFRWMRGGATLLALQKNPYWIPHGEVEVLDAGAYVAALEFATGTAATVVGKPSASFYELALRLLGLEASRVLVVGDSLENEGIGAARAGCRTALVRTGKFHEAQLETTDFRPDRILDSVADLGTDLFSADGNAG